MSTSRDKANRRLARNLLLVVVAMFGFGYALVPLYDVFCDLTGINGKVEGTAVAEAGYRVDENRVITVEFVTSLNEDTAMDFKPETRKMQVVPGKYYSILFFAENRSGRAMTAQAIPSISPGPAAEFFKKTECFCFTKQDFEEAESKKMPVRFVVDPALPEAYKTITLSYTFFDVTDRALD